MSETIPRRAFDHAKRPQGREINKRLLDEVFVISRIIKVEVGVTRRSRRLKLITLTETLIILDITKTECNKIEVMFSLH